MSPSPTSVPPTEDSEFLVQSFPVIFRHHDSQSDADLAQRQAEEEKPFEIVPAIFVKDPEEWMRFVDKVVRVRTDRGEVKEGVFRAIDPVSETVVMARRIGEASRRMDGTDDVPANRSTGEEMDCNIEAESRSKLSVEIIPGLVIKEMTIVSDADPQLLKDLERLLGENDSSIAGSALTDEELAAKREAVKDWLAANRIPVSIGGVKGDVIQVAGQALIIKPPYEVDQCFSLNEIILKKVQQLLRNRKSGSVQ